MDLLHALARGIAANGSPDRKAPITPELRLGTDGRATALVMRQNGRERTLTKIR